MCLCDFLKKHHQILQYFWYIFLIPATHWLSGHLGQLINHVPTGFWCYIHHNKSLFSFTTTFRFYSLVNNSKYNPSCPALSVCLCLLTPPKSASIKGRLTCISGAMLSCGRWWSENWIEVEGLLVSKSTVSGVSIGLPVELYCFTRYLLVLSFNTKSPSTQVINLKYLIPF